MAKSSSFGQSMRKRLSDITNHQPQHKLPPVLDQNFPLNSSSAKEQIDHLLKENEGLLKLITDKSKIIEMNGVELQKLRINLQKTQLQNWNLAQSNSHMMAELNLGKKKLKELQHQLACKDAVLKTLNFDLQVMRETNDQKCESKMKDHENAHTNRQNTNRRTRAVRSQSIGNMTTVKASEEEILENKRRRVRRHSARFTSQHDEPKEDLFEIKDLKMHEDYSTTSEMITEQKHDKCVKPEPQDSGRMSFGRPSRKAAEKINSYKEIPLNIKMRRPE
ncbi:hypothetical protein SSX86_009062 [Deinandra increscens subsp. villosa]|uniref:Shugoshin C-terminal domain-containing protein n=1 Tax=Deinandra increscens subsp. villosa TaxID=3103831 RepID=A0AAP0H5M6_9ASTR